MNNEELNNQEQTTIIPALPHIYNAENELVYSTLHQVADFCGYNVIEPKKPTPYSLLEDLRPYLYRVTFETIPEYIPSNDAIAGGCTSFIRDGKLYRNFDWNYDEKASFIVKYKDFTGMAFSNGLNYGSLNDELVGQLPYHMVDGVNSNGIMVSTHILYNDWGWHGAGRKDIPLTKVVYLLLTTLKNLDNINADLSNIVNNLTDGTALAAIEYLAQFVVSDGTKTYVLTPPESAEGAYEIIDISDNPKLTNFRWVEDVTVERENLQTRPTGVERWNSIGENTQLSDLKFTVAYESPTRLSEFIGLRETTKDSTDEELTEIYDIAHERYMDRTRNGELWQSMHSVVYSPNGMGHLYVQEDFTVDYANYNNDPEPEEEPEGEMADALWAKIWQTIRYISNVTCWTDEPDDTFMLQTRKQIYYSNVECKCGCRCICDEDAIIIPLSYQPFPANPFVKATISVVVNGTVITEEIDAEYLNQHLDHYTGKLYIMRDDFPNILLEKNRCYCLCRKNLTIELVYNAGYQALPAGLLPVICNLIGKFEPSDDCASNMTKTLGLLKSKKVGNVQYAWDKDENANKVNALFTDVYNIATLDEIMMISRCYNEEMPSELGDVI